MFAKISDNFDHLHFALFIDSIEMALNSLYLMYLGKSEIFH